MKDTIIRKPSFDIEENLLSKGYQNVCGIDEAGRGAWAGPIVSAAVILDIGKQIQGIDDSKRLDSKARQAACTLIQKTAKSFGIGLATVEEINVHGIQAATYLSYHRAIAKLQIDPDFIITDHYKLPNAPKPQKAFTFGDQLSLSIAAASILAKVERDKIMTVLSTGSCLNYGFDKNFGYGTVRHQKEILENGLCDNHRVKFVSKLFMRDVQTNLFDN